VSEANMPSYRRRNFRGMKRSFRRGSMRYKRRFNRSTRYRPRMTRALVVPHRSEMKSVSTTTTINGGVMVYVALKR